MEQILLIGNLCNNNCNYCKDKVPNKSLIQLKEELDHFDKSKYITIAGGEPSIYKDFLILLEYIKNEGYRKVKIISNGRMFSYHGFCKKVVNYVDEFEIKFPSYNKKEFKELTGVDAFEQTLNGIINLLRLNADIKLLVPLTTQNYKELYDITHRFFHLGVKNIEFELKDIEDKDILPFISQSTSKLKEIIDEFTKIKITVKNIPKCLLESYPQLITNDKNDKKSKAKHCIDCLENKNCNGIWQTYINNHGAFELKPFTNKSNFKPSISSSPKFTIVELTKKCNLDCEMCYYKKHRDEKDSIETEEFINFVTQIKNMGAEVLSLTGGEPFLRKDLPEIIKHAESIGLTTTIFTNAQLIDKPLAKKIIDSNLSYLFCSIDALNPSLNDKIRNRKGVFDRTIKAINILNDIRKDSNLKLGIGTVIMGSNLNEIIDLTKFSKEELKVDHISYKPVQAHKLLLDKEKFRMVPRDDVDLGKVWILPNQYSLLDSTIDWIVNYKKKNKFIFDTEGYLLKLKQYFRTPYNSCLGIKCETCESTCIINSEAKLIPCWGQFTPYGNIKQSAKKIWDSLKHKKLKESAQFCDLPCHNVLCNPIKRVNSYKNYIL